MQKKSSATPSRADLSRLSNCRRLRRWRDCDTFSFLWQIFRLKCIEVRLMDGTDKFGGIATLATFSVSAYRVGTSDAALHKHGRRKNQPNGRTLRRTCSRLVPAEPDRFIGYFCLVQSLPVKDRCLYSGLVSFYPIRTLPARRFTKWYAEQWRWAVVG